MLKTDGTYVYTNSAADVGVVKILRFKSDSVETEALGYAQADYSGGNTEISYFNQNTSVTQEAFRAFWDQQNEKKDAQWYEFSVKNIESKVCMGLNAEPLSEAINHQIQLIANHISLWQGDTGTELYGYAVTDLNQNGKLDFFLLSGNRDLYLQQYLGSKRNL